MKNAFTLIETLAVIIILGLIALVAVPAINKNLKKSRETLYQNQVDEIINAAKNWSADHLNELPDEPNTAFSIRLGDNLIDGGYIEEIIRNPQNKSECASRETQISINSNENATGYIYLINIDWKPCNQI